MSLKNHIKQFMNFISIFIFLYFFFLSIFSLYFLSFSFSLKISKKQTLPKGSPQKGLKILDPSLHDKPA